MSVNFGCNLLRHHQCRKFIQRHALSIHLQVGIALGCLHIGMPENLADGVEVHAQAQHDARARMTQVMEIHVGHASLHARAAPR